MEVARLFGLMPQSLLRLPTSEFRKMVRYYQRVRAATENDDDEDDTPVGVLE